MKRMFLSTIAGVLLAASTGCFHHHTAPGGHAGIPGEAHGVMHDGHVVYEGEPAHRGKLGGFLGKVKSGIHQTRGWRHVQPQVEPSGPPVGTYAYPYYTVRGPRDYFVDNPPTIGN